MIQSPCEEYLEGLGSAELENRPMTRTMFRCGFRSGKYRKLGMGFSILFKTGMRNAAMYAWPLGKCGIEEAGLRIPMSFLFGSGALEVEWKNVRSAEAFFEFPFSCALIRFAPQHPDRETDCVAIKFLRRSRRDQFLSVVQSKIENKKDLQLTRSFWR